MYTVEPCFITRSSKLTCTMEHKFHNVTDSESSSRFKLVGKKERKIRIIKMNDPTNLEVSSKSLSKLNYKIHFDYLY